MNETRQRGAAEQAARRMIARGERPDYRVRTARRWPLESAALSLAIHGRGRPPRCGRGGKDDRHEVARRPPRRVRRRVLDSGPMTASSAALRTGTQLGSGSLPNASIECGLRAKRGEAGDDRRREQATETGVAVRSARGGQDHARARARGRLWRGRLNADEWKLALGIDPFDDDLRVRLETQLLALTQRLLTLGTSVILEWGFWARVERDELREWRDRLGSRSSSASSMCRMRNSCGGSSSGLPTAAYRSPPTSWKRIEHLRATDGGGVEPLHPPLERAGS